MRFQNLFPVLALAALATGLDAQSYSRQASIRGDGNPNEGKCTVEVVVDGAAQVEIRGASAQLTNLQGQPPQWRRFECTSPMPANPRGFRFQGVDGRGNQRLIREPGNGSPAVIQIGDPNNGSEGYTFDIMWGNANYSDRGPGYPQPGYGQPGPDNRSGYGRGRGNFTVEQAISVCQDNIRQQVAQRFRTNNMQFRETRIDDNPDRNDWVVGTVEVRVPRQQNRLMRFSCSVNFENGRVRSATMEPAGFEGNGPRDINDRAIQSCERAARQRLAERGFERITLGNSRFDTDRGARVVGDMRGYGRSEDESFRFSCTVDPRDGDVQSVEVFPRDERR
jgi:hypothetical protein